MQQLSLFEQEERAAIIEYDGGQCRTAAEKVAGIPYEYRGPMPYLIDLIRDEEPLIHLFGQNPHTCLVRTLSSYEPEVAQKQAWVSRQDAVNRLTAAGYYHHCDLLIGEWAAQTWMCKKKMSRKPSDG